MSDFLQHVELTLRHPVPRARADIAKSRAVARKDMLACTDCLLGECTPSQHVAYSGPRDARFVVVGEAPGAEEVARGRPFVGAAGKLLRAVLARHFDLETVGWVNVVNCRPPGNRTPTRDERVACRHHLERALDAMGAGYVLLCGATALDAFRSDLLVTKVHGQVFVWRERYVVMATYHPAAALRERALKAPIIADVEKWAQVVDAVHPFAYLGKQCAQCGQSTVTRDSDGVPWCERHAVGMEKRKSKEVMRWATRRVVQLGLPI